MSCALRLPMALSALFLFACLAAPPALAGPAEDELGDLAGPLSTEITSEFLSTPIERIVELLQRETGVTFIIDPAQGQIGSRQVSLKVEAASAYEVIELIALSTEMDWLIQKGVVFVSTKNAIVERRVESRVFDIRGMLIQVPNYRGPSLSLDGALSNTSSGGSNARQADNREKGGSGGGGLFGADDTTSDMPSRQEYVSQITELIRSTTGEPDNWLDEVFTITELNGSLVVRATPEVLDQVQAMLVQIDTNLGKMLTIEAHYLVVPHKTVDEMGGKYVMGPKACDALFEKFEGQDNIRRLGLVRTVCHNGQRVYTYAGLDAGFLSDSEPVPDSGGVDPTISVAGSGATMDIESTISFNESHVSVAVRSDLIHGIERRKTTLPLVSQNGQNDGVGEVPLELVDQQAVRYRTNVRIPDGGGVLLAGATSMFEDIDADQFEVLLLLRTRIVKDDAEDAVE